jgi:hypothetical protein
VINYVQQPGADDSADQRPHGGVEHDPGARPALPRPAGRQNDAGADSRQCEDRVPGHCDDAHGDQVRI